MAAKVKLIPYATEHFNALNLFEDTKKPYNIVGGKKSIDKKIEPFFRKHDVQEKTRLAFIALVSRNSRESKAEPLVAKSP